MIEAVAPKHAQVLAGSIVDSNVETVLVVRSRPSTYEVVLATRGCRAGITEEAHAGTCWRGKRRQHVQCSRRHRSYGYFELIQLPCDRVSTAATSLSDNPQRSA